MPTGSSFRVRAAAGAASALVLLAAGAACAQPLAPAISPLGFLVGKWTGVSGRTVTGHAPRGSFQIEPTAGGAALLRRDHSVLIDPNGKAARTLDQVMLIYPEAGQLRADYFDGTHVIHYTRALVEAGRSVRFMTPEGAPGPAFSLVFRKVAANRVSIRFESSRPGQAAAEVIAEGEATRS